MSVYEIPITPGTPQTLLVPFPDGVIYQMRLIYQFTPNDGWLLDISDAFGKPIICGIPLVTGADLLAQYEYLNFGAALYCTTDANLFAVPKFYTLGRSSHIWIDG